jgi:colanic acid/amylovoran biosynthesis protein
MGTPITSGNRGVLALGVSIARLCLEHDPTLQITFLGSNRDSCPIWIKPMGVAAVADVVHWRMSPRGDPRHHLFVIVAFSLLYRFVPISFFREYLGRWSPWIGTVRSAVLVGDIRGGDSFSDLYGLKRFLIASLPIFSVLLIRGDIVHFPQTYGPFKTRLGRFIARALLRRSSHVIARDRQSREVAQNLVGPDRTVTLSVDVAFSLPARPPAEFLREPVAGRGRVGVNLNGLVYAGGYTRQNMFGLRLDYRSFVNELLVYLTGPLDADVLLIPHTYAPPGDVESDNGLNQSVRDALPEAVRRRVDLVAGEYDQHELKGIIGECDFFVGTRMHACIGALSQEVPCVGVAYSMKFYGVFESVGMEECVIDGKTTAAAEAVRRIGELYRDRDRLRRRLAETVPAARRQSAATFRGLMTAAPAAPPSSQ